MTAVAILTPDPDESSSSGRWPVVLERAAAALATAGITAEPTPWTDHVEDVSGLAGYPLVLPLIVWGYHRDHERWVRATHAWAGADLPLANPATVLGWNSDKAYLGRLAARGVAIPPTIWSDRVTADQLDAGFAALETETLVVKPTVSGGAWKTLRLSRERLSGGEPPVDPPAGAAMIQPYLASIESEGETSLLFFGGRFSHAVNKRPVPGDFRVQAQFGGTYRTIDPPEAALALAQRVLEAIDEPLLYARIDLARDAAGRWLLMEAELIEPDLYLNNDPAAGAGFARAVRRAIYS